MRATVARVVRLAALTAAIGLVSIAAQQVPAPRVSAQDLLDGLRDPTRWLSYSGDYTGQRHSPLTQITPQNAHRLTAQWTFQTQTLGKFEATPIVLDNVLYVTGANNYAWALDARTGRQIWRYRRELPDGLVLCCGRVNRGFGVLGDRLFMTTLDAHLVALDMRTGSVVYDVPLADYRTGHSATAAPLIVKDKVIVGIAGGENGIRGFVDAYDAATGERAWRFWTIPAPGEPGSETWPPPPDDAWEHGGASTWQSGTYDPDLDLIYWGVGNPGPDYHSESRLGDNLYSASVVAIDADTGELRWHYQFTPHDVHDWDATHIPVLADLEIGGRPRTVVMVANRNGFFYTLDRETGEVIVAEPFIETSWAKEIGPDGRPVLLPNQTPTEEGTTTCPDLIGGTNFMPPSFDPGLGLFFVTARETCSTYYSWESEYVPGERFTGGATQRVGRRYGAVRAIDPTTGERRWEFTYPNPSFAGVMSTASGVVFAGDNDGNFMAFDGRTGEILWRYQTGAGIFAGATTFMLDGRQFVLIPSGTTLTAFALSEASRP